MTIGQAKAVFEKWPEISAFYITSDGMIFIRYGEALHHSYSLEDNQINEIWEGEWDELIEAGILTN